MLLKDIVSLTSALRVQKLNTTSDPIELDLEAGNLLNSIFPIFAKTSIHI